VPLVSIWLSPAPFMSSQEARGNVRVKLWQRFRHNYVWAYDQPNEYDGEKKGEVWEIF